MNETWWRKAGDLDENQAKTISLPIDGSHLVVGPPGSGKTNILLLRASYLSRAGRGDIAVLTFNRTLREFIASGSANYPFESERVQTLRSWGASFLRSQGIAISTEGPFREVRLRILEALESFVQGSDSIPRLDCILIDEAQDYMSREIEVMRSLSRNIFAVGDDKQRIYETNGALACLETFCAKSDPLIHHYRNGVAICTFADGIMGVEADGMLDTSNYDEEKYPSAVSREKFASLEAQVKSLVERVKSQILAYPDEWISIQAYKTVTVREINDLMKSSELTNKVQMQLYEDGYKPFDPEKPIVLTTMHSAKGLEFRAAHILDLNDLNGRKHAQRLAFMSATRAKTSLNLYHAGAAPGFIERGLSALNGGPTSPPLLDELFGE